MEDNLNEQCCEEAQEKNQETQVQKIEKKDAP
jgi:hypothetical protein